MNMFIGFLAHRLAFFFKGRTSRLRTASASACVCVENRQVVRGKTETSYTVVAAAAAKNKEIKSSELKLCNGYWIIGILVPPGKVREHPQWLQHLAELLLLQCSCEVRNHQAFLHAST